MKLIHKKYNNKNQYELKYYIIYIIYIVLILLKKNLQL